jgi:hypothetical protein
MVFEFQKQLLFILFMNFSHFLNPSKILKSFDLSKLFLFILFVQSEKKPTFRYNKNFFENQLLEVSKFEYQVMND